MGFWDIYNYVVLAWVLYFLLGIGFDIFSNGGLISFYRTLDVDDRRVFLYGVILTFIPIVNALMLIAFMYGVYSWYSNKK